MAVSETSTELPFSIESFTYSWSINLKPPSLESLNNSLRFSLDHTLSDYFDLDLDLEEGGSEAVAGAAVAGGDQLHEQRGALESSWGSGRGHCPSSMMRIVKRYLGLFLRPLCRRIRGRSGERVRVDALDDRSCNDWRRSCDSECSIDEAVLHCKRSIGK